MPEMDDDALLEALGVEVVPPSTSGRTPRDERIIAGFEDILRFYKTHGRMPQHGEGRDIFERLYAVRLDQIRKLPEARALLSALDEPGLLSNTLASNPSEQTLDEEELLSALGAGDELERGQDITTLRNVRSAAQKRAMEEIAARTPCKDFEHFKPLFEQAERELKAGVRTALRFKRDASVLVGNFFILSGQLAYVAQMGEQYRTPNKETNARLRVIYSNGTESDLLLRSLQRALYKDDTGRRLSDPDQGPLFSGQADQDDIKSGTVYVLRSLSDHPFVAQHRQLIHKIGVTGGSVEARIAGAEKDATYLLAKVEVVATYKLHNLNRIKLENIFHRLFAQAQLDLTISDRFGNPVKPKEWFLVPLQVIDDAVNSILDESVTHKMYDPKTAKLVGTGAGN
jgi:hypothetical protein